MVFHMLLLLCVVGLIVLIGRVVNWVWLRPKKLERLLRKQGLNGNPYRLLSGDLKDNSKFRTEALSRPISISDDHVPRVIPYLDHFIKTYGTNSFMWIGPMPRVLILDTELIKEVMNKSDVYQKIIPNPLSKLLVTGLVSYEGNQWAKHRKIINPSFNQEKLKKMLPAFYLSSSEMVSQWENMVYAEGSCELDVWPYLQTLTADVISRTAFGSSYKEGSMVFELQKELVTLIVGALQKVYIPGRRFLPTKANKRMVEIDREIKSLLRGIVNKREKAMKEGKACNDDLLGMLMESNYKEIEEHKNNKNDGMSIEEVIDECKIFYFAGQETTSVLLLWTMVLLSKHADWQARAREEVLQVFGKNKPNYDGLNHLKIVNMILLEVLRLYPPVAAIAKRVHKDVVLGGMCLPSGIQILVPILLVHQDPHIWGDDAKEFKPERFSEGISTATKGQVAFLPFSWGPRICVGQNFAMMEAKMVLSMILQHFAFELSASYTHAPINVITIQPQYGAHLVLRKIVLE